MVKFKENAVLIQNVVKPSKTLVSTQNSEKSSLEQKWSFLTYSWWETHFKTTNC